MQRIRIVQVPPGFAPYTIREQWVGIEIPLATQEELKRKPIAGRLGTDNLDGYTVCIEKAIDALHSAGKNEAAEFWGMFASANSDFLQFHKDVCELVGA